MAADRLLGGVAVHTRRRGVPESDHPVEGLGQDRVLGGFHDQRELADALVGGLAVADVAYRGGHEQPVAGFQRAEADLDGELAPVAAQAAELQPGAHGTHLLVGGIPAAVDRVISAEPPGDQNLDRAAEQLLARVAEQRLGLGVDQPDRPGTVHDHHRVRRRFQQRAKPLLGIDLLARRDSAPAEQPRRSRPHRHVAAFEPHGLTPRRMRAHRSQPARQAGRISAASPSGKLRCPPQRFQHTMHARPPPGALTPRCAIGAHFRRMPL